MKSSKGGQGKFCQYKDSTNQNEGGGVQAEAGGIGTGSQGAGEFAGPVTRSRARVNGKKVP